MESNGTSGELSSWKEIAAYLGVSIRTAQEWERTRNLPVHRLPGPRGRVAVSVEELHRWQHPADPAPVAVEDLPVPDEPAPEPAPELAPAGRRPGRWWLVAAGLLAVVLLLVAVAVWRLMPGDPSSYQIVGNRFVVFDDRGRECWHKDFPSLAASNYALWQLVWIGDLDGARNVVFAVTPEKPDGASVLICYAANGAERWRFSPGRAVRTRSEHFQASFNVHHVTAGPFGRDGHTRILVNNQHYLYYPCQLALLDTHGQMVREYWHSGHLRYLLVADGGRRVMLAGVNNAAKSATLVTLDPDTMDGASREEDADYQLLGFKQGTELRRLVFPRSDINRRTEAYVYVEEFWQRDGDITVVAGHRSPPNDASVYYHLRPDLTLREMVAGSGFEKAHAALFAAHVLDHPLRPEELGELRAIRESGR